MLYLIHQTIDQSASRSPAKEAFRFREEAVTYAALSQRTNQLANVLLRTGIQPGDRVGIYLQKSLECAVAIHGIMKAGAAYVPLDPIAPQERIATIIKDCSITHIVSHDAKRRSIQKLVDDELGLSCIIGLSDGDGVGSHGIGSHEIGSHGNSCRVLSWEEVAEESTQKPSVQIMEQDLAYIIYTSGSTGVPKGIMHTHASGLAYARMAAALYDVTAADRLSNFPPLHFDQSTFDYFSGPLVGATTVIIPEEYTKLPASLSQLIQDEKLTIWYSVPFAMIQLLLRGALDQRDLSSLRWMIYGGEPFPVKHLLGLQAALPQARFSNNYGPAETNQCTEFTLPKLDENSGEAIPIGTICPNMSYLIVDEDDQPISGADAGELLVRSATMMQGYWNQPERNARSFYTRQAEGGLKEQYYRTGDLVVLDEDGQLWFLGRKDRQIKSRGYRIELDEIEAALLTHPAIEEGAVFPVPDSDGNTLIRSAVIAKPDTEGAMPTQSQLFKHLSQRLPAYAVPISIDIVEQFPRTTSNKIDRRSLQEEASVKFLSQL